jgi:hypothetical protein
MSQKSSYLIITLSVQLDNILIYEVFLILQQCLRYQLESPVTMPGRGVFIW